MKHKLILFYCIDENNDYQGCVINTTLNNTVISNGTCSSENFIKNDFGYNLFEIHQQARWIFESKRKEYDNLYGKVNWEIEYWGNVSEIHDLERQNFINQFSKIFRDWLPYGPKLTYWFIHFTGVNNSSFSKILNNIHPFEYISKKSETFPGMNYILTNFQEISEAEYNLNLNLLKNSVFGIEIINEI